MDSNDIFIWSRVGNIYPDSMDVAKDTPQYDDITKGRILTFRTDADMHKTYTCPSMDIARLAYRAVSTEYTLWMGDWEESVAKGAVESLHDLEVLWRNGERFMGWGFPERNWSIYFFEHRIPEIFNQLGGMGRGRFSSSEILDFGEIITTPEHFEEYFGIRIKKPTTPVKGAN